RRLGRRRRGQEDPRRVDRALPGQGLSDAGAAAMAASSRAGAMPAPPDRQVRHTSVHGRAWGAGRRRRLLYGDPIPCRWRGHPGAPPLAGEFVEERVRILFVGDDVVFPADLVELVGDMGEDWDVHRCADGGAAMAHVAATDVDVVLVPPTLP